MLRSQDKALKPAHGVALLFLLFYQYARIGVPGDRDNVLNFRAAGGFQGSALPQKTVGVAHGNPGGSDDTGVAGASARRNWQVASAARFACAQ